MHTPCHTHSPSTEKLHPLCGKGVQLYRNHQFFSRRSKLHIACPGVFLQKRRSALISLLLLSPRKLKGAFAGAPFGHTFKRGASKSVQKERHPLGVFPFGFVPFCGAPPFGDFDARGGRAGPGQCSAACGAGPKAGWMDGFSNCRQRPGGCPAAPGTRPARLARWPQNPRYTRGRPRRRDGR